MISSTDDLPGLAALGPEHAETPVFSEQLLETWGAFDSISPAAYHRRRQIVRLLLEHVVGARTLLDAGCGTGALLRDLETWFPSATLYGADVSEACLSRARVSCPHAQLFRLDLERELPSEAPGPFDVVIASEVLEHLHDDAAALARLASLLTPGGQLMVTVPAGARTRFDVAVGHVRHYSRDSLASLLDRCGFEVQKLLAWGFPFHSLYRQLIRLASLVSLNTSGQRRGGGPSLQLGYQALAAVFRPLYYLNRPYWGTQLLAVARLR